MRRLLLTAICCLIALCAISLFSSVAPPSNAQEESRQERDIFNVEDKKGKRMPFDKATYQRLKEKTRGKAKVSVNEATGAASFVRITNSKNVDLANALRSAEIQEKSETFFHDYGSLFGITNPEMELRTENEVVDSLGGKHQNYQQIYQGVPVFAGVLKTHYDKENRLYAVNGTFVPEIEVNVIPAFTTEDAAATAISKIAEEKNTYGLFAKKTKLYVYRTGLIQNVPGDDFLVWEIEVTNNENVREFLYVDAHTNKVIDQFTGVHDVVNRRAYNGNGLPQNQVPTFYPNTPFWEEGQALPTASAEANNMITSSGETYNLFMNAFGRNSFNNGGVVMDSIFNRGYSCPNASWNGTFISFCAGLTTDDITAHEWAHAYTEYTHNLIYAWQPGALNESYSDIFGETVDRINGRDKVGNSLSDPARTPGVCGGSTRWKLGEDYAPGRDMYNPNCAQDPGKVSDPQYWCTTGDNGGVHTNSGVPNHAYALLVDGGTYNGQTINPIGLTKAAHIYFRAMNLYQNSDSDFVDHADSIEQSTTDLINLGTNLNDLVTGAPSGQIVTAADLAEVQKVMLAVQMRTLPTQCNFQPLLAKNPPAEASCDLGASRAKIFANDFEGSITDWTVGTIDTTSPTFALPNWSVTNALPDNLLGNAFYASDPNIGTCTAESDQSGVRYLQSPLIQIPLGAALKPILSFDHWISTESLYDGGQLWYSVNGGPFILVPQANFIYNAHNKTFAAAGGATDNTNPRASQSAWTGTDGGSVSGSWGKTMVDLTTLVSQGQTIQFRWDMSTDGCGGTFGWYVDNINVNACLVVSTVTVKGRVTKGSQGLSQAVVKITDSSNNVRQTVTDLSGYYQFNEVEAGKNYTATVKARRYVFTPQAIMPVENIDDLNFTASPR